MLDTGATIEGRADVLQHGEVLKAVAIGKSFGFKKVLSGVSLTARAGDVIALIGASGSGKSTFLRCLNFLEKPDEGRVLFGTDTFDADIRSADSWAKRPERLVRLRRSVGMVFQSFNLWPHRTAIENVIEGPIHVLKMPRRDALDRGKSLMARVGLADRCDHYPSQLSGGQQQRVAIARALAMDPAVLLFDEPTSALDPELVGEVLNVIGGLASEGRTMVIVTHEMSFARDVATEAVFMSSGRLEERSDPASFFSNPSSLLLKNFLARFRGEQTRRG